MTRKNISCSLCTVVLLLVLGVAAGATGSGDPTFPFSDSFDGAVRSEWSTVGTYKVGETTVLGLFNDRNLHYQKGTHLTLKGIPTKTELLLTFDLYLIGTWDSTGQLADHWILRTGSGKALLELTTFPNAYKDDEEKIPVDNKGYVTVGNRDLAYWVVRKEIPISREEVEGNSLVLSFEGQLTGRKTEFWALDNVTLRSM